MKNLKLSIIIPTKNAEVFLPECLNSIKNQTYKNVELLIVDGLSTDKTKLIAKKYGAKIINNKKILAEPGVALGMKYATGDISMILAVDNMFLDKAAFKKIISVFNNKDIFAAFPKHDSTKNDSLFSKYVNTFSDPFSHFIYGNATNGRTFKKIYKLTKHTPLYDIYDFSSNPVRPLIAFAQGFCIRSSVKKIQRNGYDDIAPIIDLINKNKSIAYIYSVSLIHHTIRDLNHFIRKQQWATKNALEKKDYGINLRENTLTPWQKIKKYIYLFYGLSLFPPLIVSIYGYWRDRETIWFFHPIITFISSLSILSQIIKMKFSKVKDISRQ